MFAAEQAQSESLRPPHQVANSDHWAGQAERFVTAMRRAPQPDAFLQQVMPHLRPTDTVLDIGAGTGRHTIFLAQHVAHVVAVEPSAAMRRHLTQQIEADELANVSVAATTWPQADLPQADIAISAHVIYSVPDIGPFLSSMDARARRGCFITAGFRQPSFVLSPFWERIYGMPRLPLPGALECLNALYQLGIPAQLTLLPATSYTFTDADEALADLRWRLRCEPDSMEDAILQSALPNLLTPDNDGRLAPPDQPTHHALLWWTRALEG
jgi:SAM-dependent methyltransferase